MSCLQMIALTTSVGLVTCLAGSFTSGDSQTPLLVAGPFVCEGLPVTIAGISVTPHTYSQEMRWRRPPSPELGSLVRLFLVHREPSGQPIKLQLRFNGKTPAELLADGAWSWFDVPENRGEQVDEYRLEPGRLDVFTFNATSAAWGVGGQFRLQLVDAETGEQEEVDLPIETAKVQLTSIACLAGEDTIHPDTLVVHLANESQQSVQLERFRVFRSEAGGMREIAVTETFAPFTEKGIVPALDRSGARVTVGKLPLTHGAVEVVLKPPSQESFSLWAHLRFKPDQFDIGAGWLDVASRPGVVPLTQESFLKLLKRMHINLAHIEHVPGYTDALGEDGLYTRYPLRMMSEFADIERYNTDAWVARIHGVDALGEPQMGRSPDASHEVLRRYRPARYPTTITLSEESGFREYAGLSDYPHFDAYRVTAPSADTWWLYDRWGDEGLLWGAPLETIGEMTRTLRALSRPVPIAIWSQAAHYNWRSELGRRRPTPTPDEMLMQAYQGLANGVTGLYWYSLEAWSLLAYRDTIDITTRIGREIRLLEGFYLTGDAYQHERQTVRSKPNLDLSSIVAPQDALLFALDLDYEPDRQAEVFRFRVPRPIDVTYRLPGYLRPVVDVFRVDADGIHDMTWSSTQDGIRVKDTLDRVAIYVATTQQARRRQLRDRLAELEAAEEAAAFDPATSDADFEVLLHDLGFESLEQIGQSESLKRPVQERVRDANPLSLVVYPAVAAELGLTPEQIGRTRRLFESFQLRVLRTAHAASLTEDASQSIPPGDRRAQWRRSRERQQAVVGELLPEYRSELAQVLQPEQETRLTQITWQAAGIDALDDEALIQALALTGEQREQLAQLRQETERQTQILLRTREDGWRQSMRELRQKHDKQAMGILSAEQRERFDALKGNPFEM